MKIVFLDEYSLGGADLSAIKALGNYVGYHETRPEEVVERCADAEVVIVNKVVLGEKEMAALPALRLICVSATGVNNIDLEAAKRHNIEVKNAVGYSTHTVAEATLGSILALQRQVLYYDRYVKDGRYSASGRFVNFDRPTHRLWLRGGLLLNIGRCSPRELRAQGVKRPARLGRHHLRSLPT